VAAGLLGCIHPGAEPMPSALPAAGRAAGAGAEHRAGAGSSAVSVPRLQHGHRRAGGEAAPALREAGGADGLPPVAAGGGQGGEAGASKEPGREMPAWGAWEGAARTPLAGVWL